MNATQYGLIAAGVVSSLAIVSYLITGYDDYSTTRAYATEAVEETKTLNEWAQAHERQRAEEFRREAVLAERRAQEAKAIQKSLEALGERVQEQGTPRQATVAPPQTS